MDGRPNPSSSDDWVARRRAVRELAAEGNYDRLIPVVRDPHPRVAEVAVEALGDARFQPAVPALIETLDSKSHNLRAQAAYALRSIGDSTAVEPLIVLLERLTDSWLRAAVATVLGDFADKRALPALRRLNADDDERVRNAAQGAIFRIEPPWESSPSQPV